MPRCGRRMEMRHLLSRQAGATDVRASMAWWPERVRLLSPEGRRRSLKIIFFRLDPGMGEKSHFVCLLAGERSYRVVYPHPALLLREINELLPYQKRDRDDLGSSASVPAERPVDDYICQVHVS